jgi:general secretion pathway protein I
LWKKRNNAKNPAGRQGGFTLIEVLVALAIMALGMGSLLAAVSTGLANTRAARQYVEATRLAQSHLAAIGSATPLVAGVQSGDDGQGFTWQVRVSAPLAHDAPPAKGQTQLLLYTCEAVVSWRSGGLRKSIAIQSQRTGGGRGG